MTLLPLLLAGTLGRGAGRWYGRYSDRKGNVAAFMPLIINRIRYYWQICHYLLARTKKVHLIFGVIQDGVYREAWRIDVRVMDV